MQEWVSQIFASLKLATIWPALVGAALAVLFEFKRHTWATAALALISGAFVAYIATEPVVSYLGLEQSASNAVAGILGISGRNLIVWALTASKDPLAIWKTKDKK